jgi:hypothetical protein
VAVGRIHEHGEHRLAYGFGDPVTHADRDLVTGFASVDRVALRVEQLDPLDDYFAGAPPRLLAVAVLVVDRSEIGIDDVAHPAHSANATVLQPDSPIAHRAHHAETVRYDHDRLAGLT